MIYWYFEASELSIWQPCSNMAFSTEGYIVHEVGGPIQLDIVHYKDLYEFEILVDTVAVSLCQTDLKAAKGEFLLKPPIILGHEAAGYGTPTPPGPEQPRMLTAILHSQGRGHSSEKCQSW